MEKRAIVIIGPPGSGKGTQAKMLSDKYGFKYLGSGDCLRAYKKKDNFTGKKLGEYLDKGKLAPNFLLTKIMGDMLEEISCDENVKGVVLDGWTRMKIEALMLDEALEWYEMDDDVKIILINISEKESLDRLTKRRQCSSCGQIIPWVGEFKKIEKCHKCQGELVEREDDNIESIKERLNEYKKETSLSIKYYKDQGRLIEINGEQPIEKVSSDILEKL